jgi:hypothetical protein
MAGRFDLAQSMLPTNVRFWGVKQTCAGHRISVAIDPTETLAAPSGSAFDPGFSPYQRTCLNR